MKMSMKKEIEVKIYLKSKARPFVIIVDDSSSVNKLYEDLLAAEFIKFGPLVLRSDDIKYIIVES